MHAVEYLFVVRKMRGGRTTDTGQWPVILAANTYFYVNVQARPMHERILNCALQLQTPLRSLSLARTRFECHCCSTIY